MGIGSLMAMASRVYRGTATAPLSPASPWDTGSLTRLAWSDIFGIENAPVTREEAMRVPAIAKARAVICGTLSRQPLMKFRGGDVVDVEPWMHRTSVGQISPRMRMLWTLDDLIFYGSSLWGVERGAKGQIVEAWRIPRADWQVDGDLNIVVNGEVASASDVIYIEGPQDGLLDIARDDIKAARAMTRAWANRVEVPIPMLELHITDQTQELTEAEQDALIDSWEEARRRGGTALTPAQIETKVHGQVVADLYVQGRNAARIDVANFLNLPVALLDGSPATASLTYSTKGDSRNELVDLSLAFWATAIEDRLSMDDVVPSGSRIAFDIEYLAQPQQPLQGPASTD